MPAAGLCSTGAGIRRRRSCTDAVEPSRKGLEEACRDVLPRPADGWRPSPCRLARVVAQGQSAVRAAPKTSGRFPQVSITRRTPPSILRTGLGIRPWSLRLRRRLEILHASRATTGSISRPRRLGRPSARPQESEASRCKPAPLPTRFNTCADMQVKAQSAAHVFRTLRGQC